MTKVGILSDTHGVFLRQIRQFLEPCACIWHAGDIGSYALWEEISAFRPTIAVYGNIDDCLLRRHVPKTAVFTCEECKVFMTHIGGYPGRYEPEVRPRLVQEKPDLFISGHSHILKVMPDRHTGMLHINPGAAGNKGFHSHITAVRLDIDGKKFSNLEVFDLDRLSIS
ncbi:MAG: metallophosphatase family protein [Bacteroidales bacterium]|nr:metallophosphatase family protein [Bacteroidales bacterium]MDE7072613.1 metallophosphatase family protein [Bacteroidales bacterium]